MIEIFDSGPELIEKKMQCYAINCLGFTVGKCIHIFEFNGNQTGHVNPKYVPFHWDLGMQFVHFQPKYF